jgi:hypothetical protein
LEGMGEGIDGKEGGQIIKGKRDTEDVIKPENTSTHPLEASPPSPPSPPSPQFQADETLCVEASIRNNLIYSQNIQHKITLPACNNILTELYNNHIEVSHSKHIQKYSTAAIAVYKYPVKSVPQEKSASLGTHKIEVNQNISSDPDSFDPIPLEDKAGTQGTDLESIIIDEKVSNGLHQETQDAGDVIKTENTPTHPLEASPPYPQFQCYYCEQHFPSQSELIGHMDRESADAREKQRRDVDGY